MNPKVVLEKTLAGLALVGGFCLALTGPAWAGGGHGGFHGGHGRGGHFHHGVSFHAARAA